MSVADDINRAARQTGKQRNLTALALVGVIALGTFLGYRGVESNLAERSQAALRDAALPEGRVNVEIDGRGARLTGFADTQAEADAAAEAVAAVDGIARVENFLQVKQQAPVLTGPAGTPPNAEAELLAATEAADAPPAPGAQAGDAAAGDGGDVTLATTGVSHVRAAWDGRRLALSGAVGSAAEHRELLQSAAGAYAEGEIDDHVRVQPGLPQADWIEGFSAHLPKLRARPGTSMESSAAGLRPAAPDQETYVLASGAAPEAEAGPVATPPAAEPSSAKAPAATTVPADNPADAPAESPAAAPAQNPAPTTASAVPARAAGADDGIWVHLRSQAGSVAISARLASEHDRQALGTALRVVFPPNNTFRSVGLVQNGDTPAWFAPLNTVWALLQAVEFLDIEVSSHGGVRIAGWVPTEDQGHRILATLRDKLAPLPVAANLRSIQSANESYAAAEMLNRSFARGIGFARDQAALSWAGHMTLAQIAKILRRQPAVRLSVAVHTDARGDAETNRRLTQARADAIKARLVDLGVAADRLAAVGYGDTWPIADNLTPAGRSLNRRVVFSPL